MERATLDLRGGRPTPEFIKALGRLAALLQEQHVPCDTCDGRAALPCTRNGKVVTVCRSCAYRWQRMTPIERRQLRTRLAREGRR